MIGKFKKYWNQTNGILAIATISDPRKKKIDCVDYYFKGIYDGGVELKLERNRGILDGLLAKYQKSGIQINNQQ